MAGYEPPIKRVTNCWFLTFCQKVTDCWFRTFCQNGDCWFWTLRQEGDWLLVFNVLPQGWPIAGFEPPIKKGEWLLVFNLLSKDDWLLAFNLVSKGDWLLVLNLLSRGDWLLFWTFCQEVTDCCFEPSVKRWLIAGLNLLCKAWQIADF